jgi:hypothetical protein
MKQDSRDKIYSQERKKATPNRKVHSFDDIEKALGI